jgi:hypothetical protein
VLVKIHVFQNCKKMILNRLAWPAWSSGPLRLAWPAWPSWPACSPDQPWLAWSPDPHDQPGRLTRPTSLDQPPARPGAVWPLALGCCWGGEERWSRSAHHTWGSKKTFTPHGTCNTFFTPCLALSELFSLNDHHRFFLYRASLIVLLLRYSYTLMVHKGLP